MLIADYDPLRRIFTDGRDRPADIEPTSRATRSANGSTRTATASSTCCRSRRAASKETACYDISGIPTHRDNQSVFKERIFIDKRDPNLLHDEITVIDNALTRPWTVDKRYVRNSDLKAQWPEFICNEFNGQVMIGEEHYYLSGEGMLMPARRDQSPPDLRYFKKTQR